MSPGVARRGNDPAVDADPGRANPRRTRALPWIAAGSSLLLIATSICVFVPFDPVMPVAGVDASWGLAINEAVGRRFAFGTQVVFTYGPYASLFTTAYHPATATLMVFASTLLALIVAGCLRSLVARRSAWWTWPVCAVLPVVAVSRDALLLSVPLLVAVTTFVLIDAHRRDRPLIAFERVALPLSFAALGLIPLVKGSLAVACIACASLSCAALWHGRQRGLAVAAIVVPIVAALLFWSITGQTSAALLPYLGGTLSTVSGYSDAMSIDGEGSQVAFCLVASVLLTLAVFACRTSWLLRFHLAAIYGLFCLIAFKGSFVRHDAQHVAFATGALLMAGCCALLAVRSTATSVASLIVFAFSVTMVLQDPNFTPARFAAQYTGPFRAVASGVAKFTGEPHGPRAAYDAALARIASDFPLSRFEGSADIYSFNQAEMIASGNDWSPRPVIQSYAAYDADLLAKNAQRVEGADATRNAVFAIEPIDERLPSLEDGASWPALLANYRPNGSLGNFVILQRIGVYVHPAWNVLATRQPRLGESIAVPAGPALVYARVRLRRSASGAVLAALYKVEPVFIDLVLADGRSRRYRMPIRMAASPFLLSPLVEDTDDFARLFSTGIDVPAKSVRSISIGADDAQSPWWRDRYEIEFISDAADRAR